MTEIEELENSARKVLKAWRLPKCHSDEPHTQKDWQKLMDERLVKTRGWD